MPLYLGQLCTKTNIIEEQHSDFTHVYYGDGNAGTKIVERLRCGSG